MEFQGSAYIFILEIKFLELKCDHLVHDHHLSHDYYLSHDSYLSHDKGIINRLIRST